MRQRTPPQQAQDQLPHTPDIQRTDISAGAGYQDRQPQRVL